ncbi:helix-turn-helix domain-containing protein [Falsihalocynthiibacter sp. BN13B15]|uniref:helix-turn-helix domain-containing protein n=1 Tax=Falsihalocynthiibacter sp. BN13B15 TaxID=3240871 RepID=UPI00350FA234
MNRPGFEPVRASTLNSKLAQDSKENAELEARGNARARCTVAQSKSQRDVEKHVVSQLDAKRHKASAQKIAGSDKFNTLRLTQEFLGWWGALSRQRKHKALGTSGGVLLVLAIYADNNQEAWPSMDTIADNLGVTSRTCSSAVSKLEGMGLLTVTTDGAEGLNRGRTNRYRLSTKKMLELMRAEGELSGTSLDPHEEGGSLSGDDL